MPDLKAIFFDNDGTIVDTLGPILTSFRYMLEKELGSCSDADIEKFKTLIGLPSYDQFKEYTNDEDKIQSMIKTYRSHNNKILFDLSKNFEGLPEVLEQLYNQDYFMGIVTSKLHDVCLEGLKCLGIDKYFKYIQGPDDWHIHKPNPGALTYACNQTGYSPSEVMYVGDSIYDINAGNGAGCITCAVLWGVAPQNVLETANPDFIISKPEELLSLLK